MNRGLHLRMSIEAKASGDSAALEQELKERKERELSQKLLRIRENRQKQYEEMVENTKEISKKRKRYLELQQKYESEVVLPELEKRKDHLKKIREMHKSVDRREIE